jgi:hypothetical protein
MKRKLSKPSRSDSSEDSEVETNQKKTKRRKANPKPTKRAFEWSSNAPSQSNAYHITLKTELFDAINKRKQQVETPTPLDVRRSGVARALNNIYHLGKSIVGNTKISTKTEPIEGGRLVIQQDNVPILVRLEKTRRDNINAHVAIDGDSYEDTRKLKTLMQQYQEKEDKDAFLRGLKGQNFGEEDSDTDSEDEGLAAYQDGTKARWELLLSGIMDDPGASALVEKKLERVTSPKGYSALFKEDDTELSESDILEMEERKEQVETSAQLDVAIVGIEKTLSNIYYLGKNILANENIATKGKPIEGGRLIIQQDDVRIAVRLDKTKTPTVNARVGIDGIPDKSTKDLAILMQQYQEQVDIDAFLRGLKGDYFGEADNEIDSENKVQAYQDGTEARWVLLLSDIMDNPGSSALVEKLLEQVSSKDDYLALFIGGRNNEFSFGAIPSQNQFTGFDKNSNDYKTPFSALRELIGTGKITVTNTVSHEPVFRKLKVMSEFMDTDLITMQSQAKGKLEIQDLSSEQVGAIFADVEKKATLMRNQISREQAERHAFVQSDDEDSDQEDKKLTYFDADTKQERADRAKRNLEISQSKNRAHVRDSRREGDERHAALLLLNTDIDKIENLTSEEVKALKALLSKVQK